MDQITIEFVGVEDYTIRPWKGPGGPAEVHTVESVDVLIVNEENRTVRPWSGPSASRPRVVPEVETSHEAIAEAPPPRPTDLPG
jgi:hypothetical protein